MLFSNNIELQDTIENCKPNSDEIIFILFINKWDFCCKDQYNTFLELKKFYNEEKKNYNYFFKLMDIEESPDYCLNEF